MRASGSSSGRPSRTALMTFVAGIHLYASWWLLFRFQPALPEPVDSGHEQVMLVQFIPRAPEPAPAAAPAATSRPQAATETTPRAGRAGTSTRSRPETSAVFLPAATGAETPRRPLDLSLPEGHAPIRFDAPDPMASRADLDPRTTRFAADWATDGDAVEKLKEDSVVARTLLGLFGGRDPCTDKAIRERRDGCVGADYRPGLHEAVQGQAVPGR